MCAPVDRPAARSSPSLPPPARGASGSTPGSVAIRPRATTILGNDPAELMQCTRLVGGWAHVAMVAAVNGTIWYADGVLPAARVMERSIGVLAGVMKPDAAPVSSARMRCWRADWRRRRSARGMWGSSMS